MRIFGALFLALLTSACSETPAAPKAKAPTKEPALASTSAAAAPATSLIPQASVAAPITSAALAAEVEPQGPAIVEQAKVPSDKATSFVRGPKGSKRLTVFMGGVCSNAFAYLSGFPEAARAQGGVVAIEGDLPCGGNNPQFHSFSWDAPKQHARVTAALTAAGVTHVPPEGITLIGYSAGAGIGEQMAERWPERYTRLVLIAAPVDPSTRRLSKARGVVTMACSLDVTARMRDAAKRLNKIGVPATYVEMPGCTHGNLAEGEDRMGQAFRFLDEHALPVTGQQDAGN
jgi:predicted esterase